MTQESPGNPACNLPGNPYESGRRILVPTALVYLFSKTRSEVLLIFRDGKRDRIDGKPDFHQGKWNGLGGKLESDEAPEQGAAREVWEEAGVRLDPKVLKPLGWILFPLFKPKLSQDIVTFVFEGVLDDDVAAKVGQGEQRDEGTLHWVPTADALAAVTAQNSGTDEEPATGGKFGGARLQFWPGDKAFLPYVFEGTRFWGTIRYIDGKLVSTEIRPLE